MNGSEAFHPEKERLMTAFEKMSLGQAGPVLGTINLKFNGHTCP